MTGTRDSGGRVVAFARPAASLKRRAQTLRQKGLRVEAVELMRMALRQDDTPQNRFALAEMMFEMGNLSQARCMAYQLCAEAEVPRGAYFLLGLCQHELGNQTAAMDAMYHDLQQDNESPESDDTREVLSSWSMEQEDREHFRLAGLKRRAMLAASEGNYALARRRSRRAVKLSRDRCAARLEAAVMEVAMGTPERGLALTAAALRENPSFLRAHTMLCCLLYRLGKKRAAWGVLRAIKLPEPSWADDQLLLAAGRYVQDNVFLRDYAEARLRRAGGNIPLLHALADACWELGDRDRAHLVWEHILRVDPDNLRALCLFHWEKTETRELPELSELPQEEFYDAMTRLYLAHQAGAGTAELLHPDNSLRPWIRFMLTMTEPQLQQAALSILGAEDTPEARAALRRLLVFPDTSENTRQMALLRLTDWGEEGPFAFLTEDHLTEATLQPQQDRKKRQGNVFMRLLLTETRRYGKSREIAELAAEIWRKLPQESRDRAAGVNAYVWVKAVEALYLMKTGQTEQVRRLMLRTPVSPRRISRVLREIGAKTGLPEGMEGEETHEVH